MAHKTAVGTCPEHGEYFMDAPDSECPSCQDREGETVEELVQRLINASVLLKTRLAVGDVQGYTAALRGVREVSEELVRLGEMAFQRRLL